VAFSVNNSYFYKFYNTFTTTHTIFFYFTDTFNNALVIGKKLILNLMLIVRGWRVLAL